MLKSGHSVFKYFMHAFSPRFSINWFPECGNPDLVNAVQCAGRAGRWVYEREVAGKTNREGNILKLVENEYQEEDSFQPVFTFLVTN